MSRRKEQCATGTLKMIKEMRVKFSSEEMELEELKSNFNKLLTIFKHKMNDSAPAETHSESVSAYKTLHEDFRRLAKAVMKEDAEFACQLSLIPESMSAMHAELRTLANAADDLPSEEEASLFFTPSKRQRVEGARSIGDMEVKQITEDHHVYISAAAAIMAAEDSSDNEEAQMLSDLKRLRDTSRARLVEGGFL